MRLFKVSSAIAAPGALIGASNFFELALTTAITQFGPESGAALATVRGRRIGGSAGHAVRVRGLQPDSRVVCRGRPNGLRKPIRTI